MSADVASGNGHEIPMLTLVSIDDAEDGRLDIEMADGSSFHEDVIALTATCLVGTTGQRMPVRLIVPVSAGPELLKVLLTADQFDAVSAVES